MMDPLATLLAQAETLDAGVLEHPIKLMCFLRGAEFGDSRWMEPLGRTTYQLAQEFNCTSSLDAGSLCYLFCDSRGKAVAKMISVLKSNVMMDFEMENPGAKWKTFIGLLPNFALRAPMYIGSWSASDAFIFFEGYATACDIAGIPVQEERLLLSRMETWIQAQTGFPGRWYQIMEVLDGGRGRSVENLHNNIELSSERL